MWATSTDYVMQWVFHDGGRRCNTLNPVVPHGVRAVRCRLPHGCRVTMSLWAACSAVATLHTTSMHTHT